MRFTLTKKSKIYKSENKIDYNNNNLHSFGML